MSGSEIPSAVSHTYPPEYAPGAHWFTDAAWDILDTIKPGVISFDVRCFLAGQIAGVLVRERDLAALCSQLAYDSGMLAAMNQVRSELEETLEQFTGGAKPTPGASL